MLNGFRTLVRTGLVAIGVLFGPELIYAVFAGGVRLVREEHMDHLPMALPLMVALVSCAVWGFLFGHRYVRGWFMAVSVVWNAWGAYDVFAREGPPGVRALGVLWLLWSWRFFSLWIGRKEQPKAAS